MRRLPLATVADKLEHAAWADPAADTVATSVRTHMPRAAKDLLHGVPLGHPVHPLIVVVPLGAWVSAAVLDLLGGNEAAAKTLVGLGALAALPAAVSGATDFSELGTEQKRVGIVHEAVNVLATALYAGSWAARTRGSHARGRLLAFAGLATAAAGGFLGGHLAYRLGAGVNRNGALEVPAGWHALGPVDSFASGTPQRARLGEVDLMVLKRTDGAADGAISVLAGTCSHLGGPLPEGELRQVKGQLCIVCPWHGSTFAVQSGEVVHGPATAPQPRFATRVRDGQLEVNLNG